MTFYKPLDLKIKFLNVKPVTLFVLLKGLGFYL